MRNDIEISSGDSASGPEHIIRKGAISLFNFLRELTELRTKTIRTIENYERVIWFSKIPREPGCQCIAWHQGNESEHEDVWIEIQKPRLKDGPGPPAELVPWLEPDEITDSSIELPELRQHIIVSSSSQNGDNAAEVSYQYLEDTPEIKKIWERFIEEKWLPWAEEDRRLQVVQTVYTDLFSLYQKQQRLGEEFEVIIGLGYLTWETSGSQRVMRHLITVQTNLHFDAARGIISLGPAGEGPCPTLEQDMLEPKERPEIAELRALEEQIAKIGDDDVWDPTKIQSILKGWVYAASPHGEFSDKLERQKEVQKEPKVYLAPAIILRKRTERSLLRVYKEILSQIQEGSDIPLGIKRFIKVMDDLDVSYDDNVCEDDEDEAVYTQKDLLFPLPANKEQREIAIKLARRQGVLVQGPPGTGKSHTIANLICHLLAEGHRILVTSHTARALKVLQKKIPGELSALCVSLLGNDREALQALEDSVQKITDKHNHWDPKENKNEIRNLEQELDQARRREAEVLQKLRAVREKETYEHSLRWGSYKGTAKTIAERLRQEEARYGWLQERFEENQDPPLSNQEVSELLDLLCNVGGADVDRLVENNQESLQKIPIPDDFELLVHQEAEATKRYDNSDFDRKHPGYSALEGANPETREALKDRLDDLLKSFGNVARHIEPWTEKAGFEIMADKDRHWRELLLITREHLETIGECARWAGELTVTGLCDKDHKMVQSDAKALLSHLKKGGRIGWGPFRSKVVKRTLYLLKEIRVDGKLCNNPRELEDLLAYLDIIGRLETLRKHWSEHADVSAATIAEQVAKYNDLCEPLEAALELHAKIPELRAIVQKISGLYEPVWHSTKALDKLLGAVTAAIFSENFDCVSMQLRYIEENIRLIYGHKGIPEAMREVLEAIQTRDIDSYWRAYQTLEKLDCLKNLFERLKQSAPKLASQLETNPEGPDWKERLIDFESAWNWARTDLWFRRLNDSRIGEGLRRELDQIISQKADLIGKLAEARAWGHCFMRLTEHERQHLIAWTKAMRRIGKGTGKYAPMHRKAAREHMEECRSAIPAWIMPVYRVAETVRPGKDLFDVVIIDEASQSGVEALFLFYLAKKVIVVGDDKQISPDYFVTREDVSLLRERHIADLPHSDAIGVDNSLFDIAEIRYGGRIRLREHFRCMPEIIQFSNNLCYRSEPLIPLKQYGAGRLDPIVTQHVQHGYLKGERSVVNPPEADALVDKIVECCENSEYEGKSMGVISLLGHQQAREIESRLLKDLGPEVMEKRELVCGDAYAFQGDERDIIFLSMVSAPMENRRIGTLADQKAERRFNVAVSRAKEQVWLFHSVTLNDLSPKCLRYQLLEYCLNPRVAPTGYDGDLVKLKELARTARREKEKPPKPFDSWFEVDIFLKIINRGFRVLPQFEIAGYWIDLVVEGMQGRLAVECDGDYWHGIERYEDDMARQRKLERCGMTFWRIRDSEFARDPDEALEGLWAELERLKIIAC